MKIEVCGCSYRYPHSIKGHEYAIQDINLVVLPAQILGIVGPNGAGKSTLACLLAGLLKPSQGTVLVDGASLYTPGHPEHPGIQSIQSIQSIKASRASSSKHPKHQSIQSIQSGLGSFPKVRGVGFTVSGRSIFY